MELPKFKVKKHSIIIIDDFNNDLPKEVLIRISVLTKTEHKYFAQFLKNHTDHKPFIVSIISNNKTKDIYVVCRLYHMKYGKERIDTNAFYGGPIPKQIWKNIYATKNYDFLIDTILTMMWNTIKVLSKFPLVSDFMLDKSAAEEKIKNQHNN